MHISDKRKKAAAIVLLLLLSAAAVYLWRTVGTATVRLVSDPAAFRAWTEKYGVLSRVAFVGMTVFQIIVAIIPGEPFEIAAGYAFGAWEGTALCILAAGIGSMIDFWLVRMFGMKLVQVFFSQEQIDSVKFLKRSSRRDFLFFIVYMIPGTPKDLLGYFAGLTEMRFGTWMLICTLGRFPSVVTSTVGGNALGTENYTLAAIVFAVTLVISGLGLVIYRRIQKQHGGESH